MTKEIIMSEPFGLALPARMPWQLRAAIERAVDRLIFLLDVDDGDLDVEWNGDEFEPWGDELGDPSWHERGKFVTARHHDAFYDEFEAVALAAAMIGEDDEICADVIGEEDRYPVLPRYGLDQRIMIALPPGCHA